MQLQPYGQVPVMEEDGRPPLFETGATLLGVATRSGKLLPSDEGRRAMVMCWFFAALNSIEPPIMNLAEVDFFIADERKKADRRPDVLKVVEGKLAQLTTALGSRPYLVGDQFTIADKMMSSVLKILHHTGLLSRYPRLMLYCDRCFDRPAYKKAIADQCADIARHQEHDMKYESKKPS